MYTKKSRLFVMSLVLVATTSQAAQQWAQLKPHIVRAHAFLNNHGMKINFGVPFVQGFTRIREAQYATNIAGLSCYFGSTLPTAWQQNDFLKPIVHVVIVPAVSFAGYLCGRIINGAFSGGSQIGRGLVKLSGNRLTQETDDSVIISDTIKRLATSKSSESTVKE